MSVPAEPYKDPHFLRVAYWNRRQTQREIASVFGIDSGQVSYQMRKHDIPARQQSWSRQELIEAGKEFVTNHGRTPTGEDRDELGFSNGPVSRIFGGWPEYREILYEVTGFEPVTSSHPDNPSKLHEHKETRPTPKVSNSLDVYEATCDRCGNTIVPGDKVVIPADETINRLALDATSTYCRSYCAWGDDVPDENEATGYKPVRL